LAGKRRLLILGPSFRRRRDESPLPALERFDGLFFRVARKHLSNAKDVDVLVMTDDLTLVDATTPLAYREPVGTKWGGQRPPEEALERARAINERVLEERLKGVNTRRFSWPWVRSTPRHCRIWLGSGSRPSSRRAEALDRKRKL